MSNLFNSIKRLVMDSSVSKIEVTAAPPFVKMTFDKSELLALMNGQSRISQVIARCFIRRRVFWIDIRKEPSQAVIKSLTEVELQLDEWTTNLSSAADASAIALAKFVQHWATGACLVHKQLEDRLRDIDEEKASVLGYDSADEDRHAAVEEALIALRQRVYPIVQFLVSLLPDNDPTRDEAQGLLDSGLNFVPDAKFQRGCFPEFDAVIG